MQFSMSCMVTSWINCFLQGCFDCVHSFMKRDIARLEMANWRWRRGWYIFIYKFAVNAQPSRGNLKQIYDSLLVCMEFLLVWTSELVFHAILWDVAILGNNNSQGIAKPRTNYDKWYPFLLWSKMVPLRNSFVSL